MNLVLGAPMGRIGNEVKVFNGPTTVKRSLVQMPLVYWEGVLSYDSESGDLPRTILTHG